MPGGPACGFVATPAGAAPTHVFCPAQYDARRLDGVVTRRVGNHKTRSGELHGILSPLCKGLQ